MTAEEGKGTFKLLLESVDPENANEISGIIQKLLGVGRGQALDIIDSAPIALLDEISDREKADRVKSKFEEAQKLGAKFKVTDEALEDIHKLRWPEEPEFAKDKETKEPEESEDDVLTLVKYNFTVDRKNVFRCPHCDKLFIIRELTAEETQEANAQAEIAERLAMKKNQETIQPSAPKTESEVPRETTVTEVAPIGDSKTDSLEVSAEEPVVMDLATFEEGLNSIDYEHPEAPELALPPDVQKEEEGEDREFFDELESLPVEGQEDAGEVAEVVSYEASKKESELEELDPEEAMKFFEKRGQDEEEGDEDESDEKGQKKIVAPRRGAARRRMQRLRDKQEEKSTGKKKGSGRRKKALEEPEEEPEVEEVDHTEGYHGVVLSKIGSREKKKNAAKLISEVTGAHPDEARDMVEGTFVNVLRGVSEEEANEVAEKFREIGISAKVTLQKRKMRKSGRMRK